MLRVCLLAIALLIGGAQATDISVMTYNVENLFDTQDDPDQRDETYLPFEKKRSIDHVKKCMGITNPMWAFDCYYLDWDEAQYGLKLLRLAEVLDAAEAEKGVDVLVLQEVENLRVLEDLNRILKKPFPYILHQNSSDQRGIDVAILSRWPSDVKPSLHKIPFSNAKRALREDSREVLYVRLSVGERKVSVFGVHLPAPFHSWTYRQEALSFLNHLNKQLVPATQLSVVAGDLNIPADELKKRGFNASFWKGKWLVSHLEGCKDCKGTHFWDKGQSWSFLDMILVKAPKGGRWDLRKDSISLVRSTKAQVKEDGTPWGWSANEYKAGGVSDHFPMRLSVQLH